MHWHCRQPSRSESKPAQAGLSGNTGTDETIRNQTEIEMKTIKENGKHKFDYSTDGMLFIGHTAVALLDRKNGNQTTVSMTKLEADLPASKFKAIESALLMNNEYMSDKYHIVGLGES
jgi:hypothetical protein